MTQRRGTRYNAARQPGKTGIYLWSVPAGFALLLIASSAMYGQGVTGRIQGTVHDPSNAIVAGATVTITNQATGYHAEVPTTQAGEYLAPNMPPGTYTVSVTAPGFKV